MSNRLEGKVAVVTGGNSGIGYATAKKFSEQGATVIITGRDQSRVQAAAEELKVDSVVADVTNSIALENLAYYVQKTYGKIDILFVNAGVFFPTPVGSITEQSFDTQFAINVKGAIFTVETLLHLLRDGASIINLSSINAYTGMPNTAVYAATKAALNSYTRTAATELAHRKIRVNAVNPGPVQTAIFSKTGMSSEQLQGFAQAMQNRVPLKRFAQAEEIAHVVSFLASEEAQFITGAEINIDGGLHINSIL